jgi:death-on-curing protein
MAASRRKQEQDNAVAAPCWMEKRVALACHAEQLAEHGGLPGIRDKALLESALARPRNLASYGNPAPSLFRLAAAYAWGLAHNHPFIDGNKRTALVVAFAFLERNGIDVHAAQEEAFVMFYDLAAGRVTEDALAEWLERNA